VPISCSLATSLSLLLICSFEASISLSIASVLNFIIASRDFVISCDVFLIASDKFLLFSILSCVKLNSASAIVSIVFNSTSILSVAFSSTNFKYSFLWSINSLLVAKSNSIILSPISLCDFILASSVNLSKSSTAIPCCNNEFSSILIFSASASLNAFSSSCFFCSG
jgi:hypothetical protein